MQTGSTKIRCAPPQRVPEFTKAKDLRRRHGREAAEAIVARAAWLPDSDRQLVLAVFGDGQSVVNLACIMNQPVRILRTRVRRIVERVTSPMFAFVALNLDRWPATLRRVADACVFRGLTIKEAAADLSISYYNVRRHLDLIRTMLESADSTRQRMSVVAPRLSKRVSETSIGRSTSHACTRSELQPVDDQAHRHIPTDQDDADENQHLQFALPLSRDSVMATREHGRR